jgi:hypothetical protein
MEIGYRYLLELIAFIMNIHIYLSLEKWTPKAIKIEAHVRNAFQAIMMLIIKSMCHSLVPEFNNL